ncbi:MAG: hypothetical protein HDR17_02330 [Lachnospiraceae bacterium]|nr:hypothetical protein [Lachnospiraceae bacterium]
MIYTLCWEEGGFVRDIRVNRKQKIFETIAILIDGGLLMHNLSNRGIRIFSIRKGEYIDLNESYEKEDIFNGDILYIK